MKLRVQREGCDPEEIDIAWPVTIVPATATLWRMRDANGMEHFFTDDGYYDGWGAAISAEDQEQMRGLEDYLAGRTKSIDEVRRAIANPTIN